jgi:hypothetical protein
LLRIITKLLPKYVCLYIGTLLQTREALVDLPENQCCANQATYGMAIETKIAAGAADEARMHLGIWVAAWYQRINMLTMTSPSCATAASPIVTLPLIIIM